MDPVGDVTSDLWWVHEVGRRIKARLAQREDPRDAPLHALVWDYSTPGAAEDPDPEAVLREMNGYHADGRQVRSSAELRDDGSTRCGLWIYAGCFTDEGNHTASRTPADGRRPAGPRLGLVLAGQPARAVQPLLGATRRHPVERAQEAGLVGRRPRPRGPATTSRTSP